MLIRPSFAVTVLVWGCGVFVAANLTSPASAQSWVNFVNETSTRLISDPSVGANDVEEKDYAWGDFDRDGDTDLVVVRKQPFSTPGRKRNVLFMNEGIAEGHSIDGVLVDRTLQYASAADDGGQGMLDLTADRDVVVVDVNGDGWPDIVTATTYGSGLPKSISHPRVYINLREVDGVWQGFKYEQARTPNFGGHPNFCGVGAGDVTGNKLPDLYFVAYPNRSPVSSFSDKLLINDGNGFFTDQTNTRLSSTMTSSSFGTTAHIVDMNNNGKADIVKSENGPVKTHYNNGGGFYNAMQSTYTGSAYHATVGDLNGDGRMDIIISDDGSDRYLLNQGPPAGNPNGQATFSALTFPDSGGFNGNSKIADLNNDGYMDVVICDVDVDASGCSRRTKFFRNLGNLPNVTMVNQNPGGMPLNGQGQPAVLIGVHDVAVIDINRDGWLDVVIAQCNSVSVWINVPPTGLVFSYPDGLPGFLTSGQPADFRVQVSVVGSGSAVPGTGVLHYSVNGAPYTSVSMPMIEPHLYSATLPATECTDIVKYYFSAQLSGGGTHTDPPTAPAVTHSATSAEGTEITLKETFEAAVATWTVSNHASLTGGGWQVAEPVGTVHFTNLAAPDHDAGAGDDVKAFVTENGLPGGTPQAADVDGGPTYLISPAYDLAGTDATISYDRWFYALPADDVLVTEISNNGGATWVPVHQTTGTSSAWQNASFRVGEFVTPTSQVRVRFSTKDEPNNSVTEAGIDNFTIEELICAPTVCVGDIAPPQGDGQVNIDDLFAVINAWGACLPAPALCPADISPPGTPPGDGVVNIDDLFAVINAWGACP